MGTSDHGAGPGFGGAAVRAALPQPCRRDAGGHPDGGHPDARQAAAGGGAVGLGEHGGHRLPDAGSRGLPDRPGAQRLHGAGVSCPAAGGAAARRALCAGGSAPRRHAPPVQFDLSTRGVDPGLFPFRTWARLQKELLYSAPELLTPGDARGDAALRQALAEYLAEYRGVQCDPEQLVVGAGLEYLLGLLAPLLPGPAAVETPGYPAPAGAGKQRRALPLPAGGRGRPVADGSFRQRCGGVLRHSQPPVPHRGSTMPAGRRAELLHWAARAPGAAG